jgi:hypothetical protein
MIRSLIAHGKGNHVVSALTHGNCLFTTKARIHKHVHNLTHRSEEAEIYFFAACKHNTPDAALFKSLYSLFNKNNHVHCSLDFVDHVLRYNITDKDVLVPLLRLVIDTNDQKKDILVSHMIKNKVSIIH